jgi:hypothetical protein
MMKQRHAKQLIKMAGYIQAMSENGLVMEHYALLIEQNIYLN